MHGTNMKEWLSPEEIEQVNDDNFWEWYAIAADRQAKAALYFFVKIVSLILIALFFIFVLTEIVTSCSVPPQK